MKRLRIFSLSGGTLPIALLLPGGRLALRSPFRISPSPFWHPVLSDGPFAQPIEIHWNPFFIPYRQSCGGNLILTLSLSVIAQSPAAPVTLMFAWIARPTLLLCCPLIIRTAIQVSDRFMSSISVGILVALLIALLRFCCSTRRRKVKPRTSRTDRKGCARLAG